MLKENIKCTRLVAPLYITGLLGGCAKTKKVREFHKMNRQTDRKTDRQAKYIFIDATLPFRLCEHVIPLVLIFYDKSKLIRARDLKTSLNFLKPDFMTQSSTQLWQLVSHDWQLQDLRLSWRSLAQLK